MTEPSASLRAYEHTRQAIVSGALAGSSMITEGDIAAELGVSRTPVREAFLRLSAERLLDLIPRRGAIVVPIVPEQVDELLEVRHALETAALWRIVRAGRVSGLLDGLLPHLETQRTAAKERDLATFVDSDERFHTTIVELCGNSLAATVYAGLSDRARRMNEWTLRPHVDDLLFVVEDHEDLTDAIARGDVTGFAEALSRHLANHTAHHTAQHSGRHAAHRTAG
jgi:DNA-binding GntR family transcriptional regulator